MASSSNLKGKSVVNEEEEILCPLPLAMYNPQQTEHEQNQLYCSESEDIDDEEADHEEKESQSNHAPRTLKSSVMSTKTGRYDISATDEKKIQEMDEVFQTSPEFEKYRNSWIPVAERLKGWTIETRERANQGRIEKFYYHNSLTRQLRSKKQVYSFIRYGLVSTAAENLSPLPKRQRSQTPKEAVEAFLGESRNNLNNFKG
ncbi:hypothetical protein POM88_037815 [Heracleum sosnowskyi]|uniref:Uncharacterized protein n=1 Tax=Heracleum sosnowskyi TaxID=360622 RepID=A0AAD8HRT6_9APIA|nr:hypothetical protein POM88_037815 [Heracleum sosnowskyi]